jgi:hypothetical protein
MIRKLYVSLLLLCPFYVCLGQKNTVFIDSVPIPFQGKLFSLVPFTTKSQNQFFIYDFVSERLISADNKLNLLRDTIASAGKGWTVPDKREIKVMYRAMFAGKQHLYFYKGGIDMYSKANLIKQKVHKISAKHPNPSFKNYPVADIGFLVVEEGNKNYYIIRSHVPSAANLDYLEVYTKGFYQRPTYALYEKQEGDTASTPIKKMIIPYDKIYQEKLPLEYAYSQTITLGKNRTLITTDGATEKIRIYNLEGKEIEELGEKGKYMTAKDTTPYLPYPQDSTQAFWGKMAKKLEYYQKTNPRYNKAYYDEQADHIYREYSPSVGEGEARKRFMQVYQKKKLIADVSFPADHYIIAIENGIIWTYQVNPDGETPPKYIYKLKIQ